jgi:hypothetical protein
MEGAPESFPSRGGADAPAPPKRGLLRVVPGASARALEILTRESLWSIFWSSDAARAFGARLAADGIPIVEEWDESEYVSVK